MKKKSKKIVVREPYGKEAFLPPQKNSSRRDAPQREISPRVNGQRSEPPLRPLLPSADAKPTEESAKSCSASPHAPLREISPRVNGQRSEPPLRPLLPSADAKPTEESAKSCSASPHAPQREISPRVNGQRSEPPLRPLLPSADAKPTEESAKSCSASPHAPLREISPESSSGNGQRATGNGANAIYLALVSIAFATLTAIFLFFPRSTYSPLEKRDLTDFPDPARFKESPAAYTEAISTWFSDTEPYRDELMTLSMTLRAAMKSDLRSDADAISFHPSDVGTRYIASPESDKSDKSDPSDNSGNGQRATSNAEAPASAAEGVATLRSSGTIVVGKGPNVRALMAFGGTPKGGGGYVDLLNTLAETFPNQKVYAMVAPLATEFYLPAKAAKASSPQKPFIYSIRDRLSPKVKFVDLYDEMNRHKNEDIYLRTDHHWSPLGGHYAARRLAQTAGVPFRNLDAYDKHVIHKFVGTMYGYSKDIAVKNAPEDFVYYTPNQVDYDSEFVSYFLNKNYQIIRETKPYKAPFFKKFKDGSSGAYLTFMGSDQATVKVRTSTPGKRKLLLIKDSYGNAVPGNLFYSFPEVHIIDFRYFTQNLKDYVSKNAITDIAVCFNVFNAFSSSSSAKVKKFLTQKETSSRRDDPLVVNPRPQPVEPGNPAPSENSQNSQNSENSESSEPSELSEKSENFEPFQNSESSKRSETS